MQVKMNMKSDVAGRIRNTKLAYRNTLQPLFEAVVNSINSIEDRGNIRNGDIQIFLDRGPQFQIDEKDRFQEAIVNFSITDTGIGFNKENFESFLTADSTLKHTRGGKGLGRFTWLKAFNSASVNSVFEDDGKKWRREFDFRCTANGVEKHTLNEIDAETPVETVVSLKDYKPKYQEECPKGADVIARRIVEHCLEYFLFQETPSIYVSESDSKDNISLNDTFTENFQPESGTREIEISGEKFQAQDVLVRHPHDTAHQIHYCANHRIVTSESLSSRIPHLDRTLYDKDGKQFSYAMYISGPFLDESVEDDRTEFRVLRKTLAASPETISWSEISKTITEQAKEFLLPFTAKAREEAAERVEEYVQNEAPGYRHLLTTHKDAIKDISPHLSTQNLDLELHKLHFQVKHQLKQEAFKQLAEADATEPTDWEKHSVKFKELFRKLNDVAKSELADYVVHRKTVLSFLEKLLGKADDGKYSKEDAVHEIIFPLRKTSDEIDYENHNLWIINEGLVYHRYLASDLPFNQQANSPVAVDSSDRSDIIIFDKAFALVEGEYPFNSVVIIEFKRPERDDYSENKSPIRQVLNYVEQIKEGKAKDKTGQTIEATQNMHYYCYIISTITPNLKKEAKLHDLTLTPDGGGYFGYQKNYDAYIEIISFQKLVSEAKKRNKAFFDKLNIPTI
jgi:hypothetical protein